MAGNAEAAGGREPRLEKTRRLLVLGMVAGPLYLTVGIVQGLLREGFDFSRHALSHLANGPGGWVQTLNFAVTGLLVIAAAIGIARVIGSTSRAGTRFLGTYGTCILLASLFRADPVDGFPPGTPPGMPTSFSTPGVIHFALGALGFVCLAVSCFSMGRSLSRRDLPGVARLSTASGVIVLLGFFGGPFLGRGGILGIWIAVVVGWAWLAFLSAHLFRTIKPADSM